MGPSHLNQWLPSRSPVSVAIQNAILDSSPRGWALFYHTHVRGYPQLLPLQTTLPQVLPPIRSHEEDGGAFVNWRGGCCLLPKKET